MLLVPYHLIRHTNGGNGSLSAHKPLLASLASCCNNPQPTQSGTSRQYLVNTQAYPALTITSFRLVPSGRITMATVRPYLSVSFTSISTTGFPARMPLTNYVALLPNALPALGASMP